MGPPDDEQQPDSPLAGSRSGTVRFGHFDGPIGPIRAADHVLRSPMGGFVTSEERDAAFRSFQFIGAIAPDMAAGCAVTRTESGLTAFAYLWAEGALTEVRINSRSGDTGVFADDPDEGTTQLITSR